MSLRLDFRAVTAAVNANRDWPLGRALPDVVYVAAPCDDADIEMFFRGSGETSAC